VENLAWTIRFEVGAQTLTLCRSRRGDLEDLNGWWRTLEESHEIPQVIGSSGVARRSVTGKRSDRRSGGRCELLIKHLELSAFQKPRIPRSRDIPCTLISRNVKTRKNRHWDISTFQQPGIPRRRDIPCTLILRNVKT
jgi:hypothetical protein